MRAPRWWIATPKHGSSSTILLSCNRKSRPRRRNLDLGKIVTRDEPVERHPTSHEKVDEVGDEVPRSTVALDHAAHSPAALQPWHLEADLRVGASAADQDAHAETSQPIYCKPKHGRH